MDWALPVIEYTFPFYEWINGWLLAWMPGVIRIVVWGAISGCAAMLLFLVSSDQAGIVELKGRTRELQRRMLGANINHSEVMKLARSNLVISFRLLGKVGLPSLLASLPVLLAILWLSAFDTYALPPDGETVRVDVIPGKPDLTFLPKAAFVDEAGTVQYVVGAVIGPVQVLNGDRMLYSGDPANPPVGTVRKEEWWNVLLGSVAGYIQEDASVDELHWNFPRKSFISGAPEWLSTWEFPFFLSLLVVALGMKIGLRIH